MRNKDMTQVREGELLQHYGALSPLAAIDHEQFTVVLNDLTSRQMALRRGSGATAQYV